METLDFVLCMAVLISVVLLVNRYITMKEAVLVKKYTKETQIAAQNRLNAQQKGKQKIEVQEPDQVGNWLPELLDGFGIDPEVIFQDEMPKELQTFLPLIKSYVNAQGGIGGIAQKLQNGQVPDQGSQTIGI
jgi:hypothetical protein